MVVEIEPEDIINDKRLTVNNEAEETFPELAVLHFQEELERQCWLQGGRRQTAPAQRMVDFTRKKLSYDLPESSYSPGLISSPLHFWMPEFIAGRLIAATLALNDAHQQPDFILFLDKNQMASCGDRKLSTFLL